jgi:polysaccharide export outer membrane protein
MTRSAFLALLGLVLTATPSPAQAPSSSTTRVVDSPAKPNTPSPAATQPAPKPEPKPVVPAGVELPPGYVIGLQDVLDVSVWKEKDMSAEGVVVRPDGKISLPLVNDVDAVGLTVDQLRSAITERAAKFVQEPEVSVVVKQINSRRVSITGQVAKPGQYALLSRTTVVELIAMAGGAAEFANIKKIRIARIKNGKTESILFNFKDFQDGKPKALEQNIELMPGDMVTVP